MPGTAVVPAARGFYAVRAQAQNGRVTELRRLTPTDHLLAPGGILAQSLATLPPEHRDLADLVVDIIDPCVPVRIKEVANA